MNYGWRENEMEHSKLQDLNQFTFGVKIEVCGVFDTEDNDVTDEYSPIEDGSNMFSSAYKGNEELKSMKDGIELITSKMDQLLNKMNEMEQRIINIESKIYTE